LKPIKQHIDSYGTIAWVYYASGYLLGYNNAFATLQKADNEFITVYF